MGFFPSEAGHKATADMFCVIRPNRSQHEEGGIFLMACCCCNPTDQYLVAKHAVVFRPVMSNCTMYSVR